MEPETEQLHPDGVVVIPEIVAEVVGYARSPMRRNGMFLMVDVGASTLDVATFMLTEEDHEDAYPILYADVKRLGAYVLHKRRIGEVVRILEERLCSLSDTCDGITPLPELDGYLPEPSPEDHSALRAFERAFCHECAPLFRKVVWVTKDRRNPLSDAWRVGIPVFLCGGGSRVKLYSQAIRDALGDLQNCGIKGFRFEELPKPDNLETEDIPPRDYHRMAVSYGLSFSEFDIGKIIPQRELDDIVISESSADIRDRYVGKEMV